jgi:hypothetical protein
VINIESDILPLIENNTDLNDPKKLKDKTYLKKKKATQSNNQKKSSVLEQCSCQEPQLTFDTLKISG